MKGRSIVSHLCMSSACLSAQRLLRAVLPHAGHPRLNPTSRHRPAGSVKGRHNSSNAGRSRLGKMFLAPKDLAFIGCNLELTVPHATHLHAAKLSASRTEVLSILVLAAALSVLTKVSSSSAWWQLALAAWGWLELLFYSLQLVR